MMSKKYTVYVSTCIMLALMAGALLTQAQGEAGLIAPGAELTEVRSGFQFTEGPAADKDGNIYFTDVRAARIYKWSYTNNSIVVYRENTGGANGLMFDPQGRLIVCEMGQSRLSMDDGRGTITILAEEFEGQSLHGPNDLWIDANGGLYFSDWISGGRGKQSGNQAPNLQVYYLTPDHGTLLQVTDDLMRPNGVIGTPDGKTLYIADMGADKTWAYGIQPDGTLTNTRLFCDQGSDGMALDVQGNLYLTTNQGLVIYNPDGQQIGSITVPIRPTNMTFGGADRTTLFITARTSVYTLKMSVKGAATPLDLGDYTQELDAVTAATKKEEDEEVKEPSDGRDRSKNEQGLQTGAIAPTFTLQSLNGEETFALEDFRGDKPVVLFFGSYT